MVWLSEPRFKQQPPLSDSGGSDASHEGQKLGKVVLTTLWGRAGLVLEAKLPLWGLPRLFCSSSLDEALAKLPNSTFSLERFHCRAAMIRFKYQLKPVLDLVVFQESLKFFTCKHASTVRLEDSAEAKVQHPLKNMVYQNSGSSFSR